MSGKLFEPLEIGGLKLKNRIFMAPLTRARSGPSRIPGERQVKYYTQRAAAGLLITEATVVSTDGLGWKESPGVWTEEMRDGWRAVTDAVHAKGGSIFCQLWHAGRAAHSSFIPGGDQPVAPSAISIGGVMHVADGSKQPNETPRALETDEIRQVVESFRHGAQMAKDAGFDGIELHGANGYIIDQFLQSVSNQRTDEYGGSPEKRYRFLQELLDAVTSVWPVNRVAVRISPNGVYNGMGSEDNVETFTYVAQQLDGLDLAYLHVMDGLGFGFHEKCPAVTLEDLRKVYRGRLVGNVGYTQETAEAAISAGHADAIAFGRPFISNPDLVERFANGWPLADPADPSVWYTPRDDGYTDWPTYQESTQADASPQASEKA